MTVRNYIIGLVAAVPDSDPQSIPGLEGLVDFIGGLKWLMLIVCVACMVGVGGMFALSAFRPGHGASMGGEGVTGVVKVLVGAMIVSGAASIVGFAV